MNLNDSNIENENGKDTGIATSQTPSTTVEIVRQQRFEVGPRYTNLKFIGEGAYGMSI